MTEILTPITERTPTASSTGYLPIEEHGVIGDLRSVAFVGTDGTIDWYCPGRFDAPSVFASLLDSEKGGHFRIQPADGAWKSRQLYFPDTNVLITRFSSKEGVAEVIDFMPVMAPGAGGRDRIVRTVLGIRGEPSRAHRTSATRSSGSTSTPASTTPAARTRRTQQRTAFSSGRTAARSPFRRERRWTCRTAGLSARSR